MKLITEIEKGRRTKENGISKKGFGTFLQRRTPVPNLIVSKEGIIQNFVLLENAFTIEIFEIIEGIIEDDLVLLNNSFTTEVFELIEGNISDELILLSDNITGQGLSLVFGYIDQDIEILVGEIIDERTAIVDFAVIGVSKVG